VPGRFRGGTGADQQPRGTRQPQAALRRAGALQVPLRALAGPLPPPAPGSAGPPSLEWPTATRQRGLQSQGEPQRPPESWWGLARSVASSAPTTSYSGVGRIDSTRISSICSGTLPPGNGKSDRAARGVLGSGITTGTSLSLSSPFRRSKNSGLSPKSSSPY